MPLVRVAVPKGSLAEYRRAVGEEIYTAMVEVLKVPKDDRFQVISEHDDNGLVVDPTYLGIERSKDAILIQITLNDGRGVELKKAFVKTLADGLHQRVGLRREDVFINLVEVKKENLSFGNGESQYAQ
jgi:4-oxalocrotonate tautomerase